MHETHQFNNIYCVCGRVRARAIVKCQVLCRKIKITSITLWRRHENDKHETSCYAHFLKKKISKINTKGRMLCIDSGMKKKTPFDNKMMKNIWITRRVLHIPLFVARARVCHTHSMHTKNEHNRKWLIIMCLFFTLFVHSHFFSALRFL